MENFDRDKFAENKEALGDLQFNELRQICKSLGLSAGGKAG
jgi:hypothetical protein